MSDLPYGICKHNQIATIDLDKLTKKNRVICHPDDYVKMAESGFVKLFVDAGVNVIQSELAEPGRPIATGALAVAIMKETENKG